MSMQDALARVTRALEALRDGDRLLAEQLLDDLARDLWGTVEGEERAA